jgi:nucleoside-diphosphate-sugar epimerase
MPARTMLVLGSRSFLGRSLADALTQSWMDEGVSVTRFLISGSSSEYRTRPVPGLTEVGVHYSRLSDVIVGPIDLIVHAASPTAMVQMIDAQYRKTLWQLNVEFTDRVIALAEMSLKQHERKCDLIFFSSREVYAGIPEHRYAVEGELGSSGQLGARSLYRTAKILGENLVQAASEDKVLDCFRLRIAHVYGPGMRHRDGRVLGDLLSDAQHGNDVFYHGAGSRNMQPLHIDDFIEAARYILQHGKKNVAWNVAHPDLITIQEVAHILASAVGTRAISQPIPSESSSLYLAEPMPMLSTDKLTTAGWSPSLTHAEGFSRLTRL